ESAVASCVVFDEKGALKKEYRKFNIQSVKSGDDYAAISEAVERYFGKCEPLPQVVIIDGGIGQLHAAEKVLEKLKIEDIKILSVAKGASRKPGYEQIFISGSRF